MSELKEVAEGVYLRKSKLGYSLCFPIKKDKSKKLTKDNIDWDNFWGKRNKQAWISTALILLFILASVYFYMYDINKYRDIAENPWDYYATCSEPVTIYPSLNMTNFTKNEN
jgi:hypothetical protein